CWLRTRSNTAQRGAKTSLWITTPSCSKPGGPYDPPGLKWDDERGHRPERGGDACRGQGGAAGRDGDRRDAGGGLWSVPCCGPPAFRASQDGPGTYLRSS